MFMHMASAGPDILDLRTMINEVLLFHWYHGCRLRQTCQYFRTSSIFRSMCSFWIQRMVYHDLKKCEFSLILKINRGKGQDHQCVLRSCGFGMNMSAL